MAGLTDILTALQNGVEAINNLAVKISSGGGSSGSVTDVAGIDGITATPDPITGSGTVGLSAIADNTVLGNVTGGGVPTALSTTQLTALISLFATSASGGPSGTVPPSSGGTTNYLRSDGTWSPTGVSSGGGTVTFVSAGSGLVTSPSTGISGSGSVSLAPISVNNILANVSSVSAAPTGISTTQLTALVNLFQTSASSGLSGGVTASSGSSQQFLRADGTWQVPPTFSSTGGGNGYAPSSTGATTQFLRADGSWAIPATTTGQIYQIVYASGASGSSAAVLQTTSVVYPSWTTSGDYGASMSVTISSVSGSNYVQVVAQGPFGVLNGTGFIWAAIVRGGSLVGYPSPLLLSSTQNLPFVNATTVTAIEKPGAGNFTYSIAISVASTAVTGVWNGGSSATPNGWTLTAMEINP